jgi:hypothetical protein
VALWKDRLEDDGALHASETTLRRIADAVVAEAIRGLRRAFVEGDVSRQWRRRSLALARLFVWTRARNLGWARGRDQRVGPAAADARGARALGRADPAGVSPVRE